MIPFTFCCFDFIDKNLEKVLWEANILSWNDFLQTEVVPIESQFLPYIRSQIQEAQEAWKEKNLKYFAQRLPVEEYWRFYPHVYDRSAYLDIETTGLEVENSQITTVCIGDLQHLYSFVNGKNFHLIPPILQRYPALVTYYGTNFDLPFLIHHLNIDVRHQIHIDLQPILHTAGFRGGLKACEQQFGIIRKNLPNLRGPQAIQLWELHCQGKKGALETLLAYNAYDVIHLPLLFWNIYQFYLTTYVPFGHRLACPPPPLLSNPFPIDDEILNMLTGSSY